MEEISKNSINDKVTLKVILLYICENMDSLTHEAFMETALESMYMDYFKFSSLLKELLEENLITASTRKHESSNTLAPLRYSLTQSGLAVLNTLRSNIPQAITKYLHSILAKSNQEIKNNDSIEAHYKLLANGSYSVYLALNEGLNSYFKLELEVPNLEIAKKITNSWKENASTSYPQILYFISSEESTEQSIEAVSKSSAESLD